MDVLPLLLSVACQTSKAAFFEILVNPIFTGDVIWQYIDEVNSAVEVSYTNAIVTGGKVIGAVVASIQDSQIVKFNEAMGRADRYGFGMVISVVGRVSASPASDMQVSLTWQEDV